MRREEWFAVDVRARVQELLGDRAVDVSTVVDGSLNPGQLGAFGRLVDEIESSAIAGQKLASDAVVG
jgi:hypothetical protein